MRRDPQGSRQVLRLACAFFQAGRGHLPRALAHLLHRDAPAAGVAALQRAAAARAIARPAQRAASQGAALARAARSVQRGAQAFRRRAHPDAVHVLYAGDHDRERRGRRHRVSGDFRQHRQFHLALRHAPAYRAAAFDPDIARAYNIFFGMDHIDEVASCFEDCAAKKFPKVLMGNGACNSHFDPTYAPPGQHAAFWWPFAPYSVDGGPQEWDRNRKDYTQRILDYWRVYASNLEGDNLLGSTLFTPLDVERLNINCLLYTSPSP